MPRVSSAAGFASVYDVLYADPAFLAAQRGFLAESLLEPGRVLDAGCGTGQHLCMLASLGHVPVGLDVSLSMLKVARERCGAATIAADFMLADIRRLPFAASFDAIVCLESPLAYLLDKRDLVLALQEFRRVLRPGGRAVIDVFDYPAVLPRARVRPATRRFTAPWGFVDVTESHRHDRKAGVWHMFQRFRVERDGDTEEFAVKHKFRIRNAEQYAAAIEAAGLIIDTLLPAYPGLPPALAYERRMLFVARRKG